MARPGATEVMEIEERLRMSAGRHAPSNCRARRRVGPESLRAVSLSRLVKWSALRLQPMMAGDGDGRRRRRLHVTDG